MCRSSFAHKCLFSLADQGGVHHHVCGRVPEGQMAPRAQGMCLVFLLTHAKRTRAAGSQPATTPLRRKEEPELTVR